MARRVETLIVVAVVTFVWVATIAMIDISRGYHFEFATIFLPNFRGRYATTLVATLLALTPKPPLIRIGIAAVLTPLLIVLYDLAAFREAPTGLNFTPIIVRDALSSLFISLGAILVVLFLNRRSEHLAWARPKSR